MTAETPSGASYTCEGLLLEPKDLDVVVLKFKARGVQKLVFGDASKITEGQKVVVKPSDSTGAHVNVSPQGAPA